MQKYRQSNLDMIALTLLKAAFKFQYGRGLANVPFVQTFRNEA